jgi:uncharacterized phage protein (TIGR02218 family)
MRTVSPAFLAALQGDLVQLCTCWLITCRNGVTTAYTDHLADVPVDGVVFRSVNGFTRSSYRTTSDLSVNTFDVNAFFDDNGIIEANLRAGIFELGSINVYVAIPGNPSAGTVLLTSGLIGNAVLKDGNFQFEFRSLRAYLALTFGECYSPLCNADFGDVRCTVNTAPYTFNGSVQVANGNSNITANISGAANGNNDVQFGTVTWLTGPNRGFVSQILNNVNNSINFTTGIPYTPNAGDTFTLVKGCAKTRDACIAYNNILNMRSAPDVPGQDTVRETPDYSGAAEVGF